jgi:hypothetical protein
MNHRYQAVLAGALLGLLPGAALYFLLDTFIWLALFPVAGALGFLAHARRRRP